MEAYISKSGLKSRGWTEKAITTFLPLHDKEARNPIFSSAAPVKLYLQIRVEDIEQMGAFKEFARKNKNRIAGAAVAVVTKKTRLLGEVSSWNIGLPSVPLGTVRGNAIRSYNQRRELVWSERWSDFGEATPSSDIAFLDRITVNFIRHHLSCYDGKLEQLFGKVGKAEAYSILNRKIYAKISSVYPELAAECRRQLKQKSREQSEGLR